MNRSFAEYLLKNPTAKELQVVLGAGWAIARKTPGNLERYQRCITPREYTLAQKAALARRTPEAWASIRKAASQ